MNASGRSLELFFVDGRPDGMLTAEVFNWTGHVLRIPRTQIKQGLERPETNHTGVYVLIGQIEGIATAYIGEAENMGHRLRQHVSGKDWWDEAILVSSTGDMLHKAHVKYLESRLVEIARSVGKIALENSSTPPRSSLTEAALANMESFLETLSMVFPAIRVDMFLEKASKPKPESDTAKAQHQTFELRSKKLGIDATAELSDGQWIVQAGSKGRSKWVGTNPGNAGYRSLISELLSNGTLEAHGAHATFTKGYAFSSPSAAAAVVFGRAANGRTAWITSDTKITFAQWEEQQLLKDPVTP